MNITYQKLILKVIRLNEQKAFISRQKLVRLVIGNLTQADEINVDTFTNHDLGNQNVLGRNHVIRLTRYECSDNKLPITPFIVIEEFSTK